MLNQLAFANALAILTAVIYVLFALVALVSPWAFQFLFNAQFFGADVASLLPKVAPSGAALATFIVVVIAAWVVAYAWAWLYNRFTRML